jgi:hypothetical protein
LLIKVFAFFDNPFYGNRVTISLPGDVGPDQPPGFIRANLFASLARDTGEFGSGGIPDESNQGVADSGGV